MNLNNCSPKESIRQLSMIFALLLIGILIFSGFVVFFIVTNTSGLLGTDNQSYDVIKWVFLALVIVLIPLAIICHRKQFEHIDHSLPLEKKMVLYRNSFIVKIMIIDFICMMNSLLLLLYGKIYLLAPLALFITYFILNRPFIERISDELNLTYQERSLLKD